MSTNTAAAEAWADAFAAYEARQVYVAVYEQRDLPPSAEDRCDHPNWLLGSLAQHPDEMLVDTVGAPAGTDPATVRAAVEAIFTARLADADPEPTDAERDATVFGAWCWALEGLAARVDDEFFDEVSSKSGVDFDVSPHEWPAVWHRAMLDAAPGSVFDDAGDYDWLDADEVRGAVERHLGTLEATAP